ncbi:uncharacterized protein IWZ02DRAFT_462302 [Phyllosticta citriasiana]|uniref:uncharacterized protein n=1 Tax=Phyllosticta citriasiana TaxID=595635 RepID=UPI0030FDAC77
MASEAQDPVSAALEHPSHPLDTTLFDTLLPFISPQLRLDQATIQSLVQQLARLLPQLQQDPAPVIQLLTKLIEPFDFDSIRSLQPPVDFSAGLDLAALPFHTLALSLLEKAIFSSRHAEFIASTPDIVSRLSSYGLLLKTLELPTGRATSVSSSSRSTRILQIPGATASYGTGFMWKRVFGDKDVYSLFFALCGARRPTLTKSSPSRSRKTLWSQVYWPARLYLLACRRLYGDVLMHISLMDFFSDLLKSCNQPSKSIASHHESIALEYLNLLPLPACRKLLATYASTYPSDFETAEATRNGVLHRMMDVLKNVKTTQWAHGESPHSRLHVLSSLPLNLGIMPSFTGPSEPPTQCRRITHSCHDLPWTRYLEEITFPVPVATPNSSATSPARIEAESTAARSSTTSIPTKTRALPLKSHNAPTPSRSRKPLLPPSTLSRPSQQPTGPPRHHLPPLSLPSFPLTGTRYCPVSCAQRRASQILYRHASLTRSKRLCGGLSRVQMVTRCPRGDGDVGGRIATLEM